MSFDKLSYHKGDALSLPKGWEIKKLGDVCETGAGGTPLKTHKDYYEGGTIPWLLSGEVSQGEIFEAKNFITEKGLKNSSAKLFPPNTVLVAMYGATAGQVGILRFEAATNQAVCGILPNDKTIPEYLFYCFLEKKEELVAQAVGGAQPNISQIKIKNTKIPLPPLQEQQRIVSILDEAFAAIAKAKANAEQNLKNAKELFESVLNSLIIDDGKLKMEKLGDVCEIKGRIGYRGYTVQDLVQKGEGAITLSPSNIQDNKFITDKCTYISWFKYEESPEIMVFEGDILFVKTGSTYGKVALVENLPEKATINPQFVVLKDIKCSNRFLYYALTTKAFKEKVENIVGGAATPTLSQTNLAEQTIPLPPFEEQQTIVRQLDALRAETQKLEAVYQQKIDDLEELKKSILQKAFAGELTESKIKEPCV